MRLSHDGGEAEKRSSAQESNKCLVDYLILGDRCGPLKVVPRWAGWGDLLQVEHKTSTSTRDLMTNAGIRGWYA
jgi:hypothetical protein